MNMKLLVTSLAATALIGCGGSSSSPTPTPEATPTPTPEVTPTPTPEVTPTPTPEVTPTPTPEVTPTPTPETSNKFAQITDTDGGDGADTGELRIALSTALPEGKVTMRISKDITLDGFVNLSGTSTSRDNAMIDLRVSDSSGYSFTAVDSTVNSTATFPDFENNEWINMEITWDAASASATTAPLMSMTIAEQALTEDEFSSESADLTTVMDGVKTIQFRFGGGSDFDDTGAALLVDDIKVYSDTDGNTEVCSIDFEDDDVDSVLNESADNAAFSPCPMASITFTYHENSFQATVGEE